jgi:cobaltochelatase CobS
MNLNMIKHSERTVRKGCKHCGDKDLYWGHDPAVDSGKYCAKCDTSGKWLLIDRDGNPHVLSCPAAKTAGEDNDGPVSEPESNAAAPSTPTPTPAPAPANPAPDAYAAFQALMSSLAPKVDRAEVESMIRAQLDAIVFPIRTVVERASGEVREVTGAHHMLGEVVTDLLAGLHVMMVGPAGTGKSTIAENAADALGLAYYSISLSPMTPASQILGYMQAEGEYVRSLYREAYEHGGVFHFDEIDNSHPSVLAVINASLSNGHMAFPDGMVKRHPDFRCVASANTYGRGADRQYVGRQQMDAATLDRFAVETILVDETLETEMCKSTGLDGGKVNDVLTYVRRLRKSAEDQGMRVIVSPRASVGMCKLLDAGKSWNAAAEAVIFKGMSTQDRRKLGV